MTIRIVYSFEIPGRGARALGHHLWIITSLFRNRNLALNHYSKNMIGMRFIVSYLSYLSNHLACMIFNAPSIWLKYATEWLSLVLWICFRSTLGCIDLVHYSRISIEVAVLHWPFIRLHVRVQELNKQTYDFCWGYMY